MHKKSDGPPVRDEPPQAEDPGFVYAFRRRRRPRRVMAPRPSRPRVVGSGTALRSAGDAIKADGLATRSEGAARASGVEIKFIALSWL